MKNARLIIIVCALAAACAEAGGDAKGGELTDAGQQAVAPGEFTAVADAGLECGEGTTWSSLYRDIFGPTGKPGSCSFASTCHGSPSGDGAKSGAGIQCFDQATCRQSMIDRGLVSESNAKKPENAILFGIIRHRNEKTGKVGGIMPKEPNSYAFPAKCIERMRGWIAAGIPDD